jgi:hypothetical protein
MCNNICDEYKEEEVNVSEQECTVKFDSACSRNMSGVKGRLGSAEKSKQNIIIKGFNGNTSNVSEVGLNEDGKIEYFVNDMPSDMVLLSAHDYAMDGAAILFDNSGVVLHLTKKEKKKLENYVKQFNVTKQLVVKNRTYEVKNDNVEQAMSNSATKYFNSKINVSNNDERIMAMLLTGLSFADLYSMVKSGSALGLPRDMTIQSLNNFEHKYGKTPDIIQMALPNLAGNSKGYMAPTEELIKADFLVCEFNEVVYDQSLQKKTIKIPSLGGAVAAYICVDAYSGYPIGWLVESVANAVNQVRRTVEIYRRDGYEINLFAADQGIITQSQFSVILPEVQRYLLEEKINILCGEAYNHDNGLTISERNVRTIKELMRFAVMYLLNNPNFNNLGFTRKQVFQLWGELYAWALWVIRLKRFSKDKSKTKYEVYHNKVPDLRSIRLLPIFAVVYALRRTKISHPLQSNREFWQRGLYVGPSDQVPGAIRVAVLTRNKSIKVVVTTIFKGVSDGGNINPYNVVNSHVHQLNKEQTVDVEDDEEQQSVNSLPVQQIQVEATSTANKLRGGVYNRDKEIMQEQVKNWGSREERMKRRNKSEINYAITSTELMEQINSAMSEENKNYNLIQTANEEANFVDWSTHTDECVYYSFTNNCYFIFENYANNNDEEIVFEVGYKAVTEGIPKSLFAAMSHPVWGEAARTEFGVVTQGTGAIVKVNQQIAKENISNGADCMIMLAVYEEKIKDGIIIKKVRMVANGKQHKNHGPTYSPTPSREEFLIIMHLCASNNWDYYWLDEQRAFLTANRNDERPVYVKFQGDSEIYGVQKALYGTKDASRDYHIKVDSIMYEKLLCEKLHMCSCIYIKCQEGNIVIIFDHVDDFVFTGNNNQYTLEVIKEFKNYVLTDEPMLNAPIVLGMEITRDKSKKIIMIKMEKKINDLVSKYLNEISKKRNVPMPTSGYVVREHEVEMLSEIKKRILYADEISIYMSIVGALIWLQGIRLDIIFAVLYLSWNTRNPMQHHMDMALYVIGYLNNTINIPLVLGGDSNINVNIYFDASHGTGPRSRSITGVLAKLNPNAGAVYAKSSAQATVKLSSFESELDGVTTAMKTAARITNILKEMQIKTQDIATAYNDNEANIEFVKGNSVAKGVRHMELRMWYTREEYKKGNVKLEYMKGTDIPADKLTKLGNVTEHRKFTADIQGLNLMNTNFYSKDEHNLPQEN